MWLRPPKSTVQTTYWGFAPGPHWAAFVCPPDLLGYIPKRKFLALWSLALGPVHCGYFTGSYKWVGSASFLGLWVRKFTKNSGGKFPDIYSNLSGNFRKFVYYLCQSAVSKCSIPKWCYKISMFLTNNSPDLYAISLCITFIKNNLFLARLERILASLNENYRRFYF